MSDDDGRPGGPGRTGEEGGLLGRLEARAGGLGVGAYAAAVSVLVLSLVGVVGLVLGQPWLFPSLGPTLMVIAETPRQPAARPRNVLLGHLVGLAAGHLALVVTGLTDAPAVTATGIDAPRVVAAALSLAVTALALQVARAPHPPAGATTLIVSLGVLGTPADLATIAASVLLVTAAATGLNRLAGVRRPGGNGAAGG